MIREENQADIVFNHLMKQEKGKEVVDMVNIPDLERHFEKVPKNAKVEVDTVRPPGLKELAVRPRMEIANLLIGLLDYRKGIVGIEWKVGSDAVQISYVTGFQQKEHTEEDRQALIEVMSLILRVRREIVNIKWNFGEKFVEITHIV